MNQEMNTQNTRKTTHFKKTPMHVGLLNITNLTKSKEDRSNRLRHLKHQARKLTSDEERRNMIIRKNRRESARKRGRWTKLVY